MEKMDSNRRDFFINYVPDDLPSLRNLTLVSSALALWGDQDIKKYISKNSNILTEMENAYQNLFEIPLPVLLKAKIYTIIKSIELNLSCFVNGMLPNYSNLCYCVENYSTRLFWTSEGTIDEIRTFREVMNTLKSVDLKKSDLVVLYELACKFCLEEYIRDLLPKVSSNKYETYMYMESYYLGYDQHLLAYWTAIQINKTSNLVRKLEERSNPVRDFYNRNLSIFVNMVRLAVYQSNIMALKYFWNKLTEHEIDSNVERWIVLVMQNDNLDIRYRCINKYKDKFHRSIEIMCFLLSHVKSPRKQKDVFQAYSEKILYCLFYHWPLRKFFLPTITAMFDVLEKKVYFQMMSEMLSDRKDKNESESLLLEVWRLSPSELKKAFLNYLLEDSCTILYVIAIKDHTLVDIILSDATTEEKKLLTFHLLDKTVLENFLRFRKLSVYMIDMFASKALLSYDDLNSFRQKMCQVYM